MRRGDGGGREVLTQKLDPRRCKEASSGQQEGARIRGKEVLPSVFQEEVSSRPASRGGGWGGMRGVHIGLRQVCNGLYIYVYIVMMGCCACRIV